MAERQLARPLTPGARVRVRSSSQLATREVGEATISPKREGQGFVRIIDDYGREFIVQTRNLEVIDA